MKPILLIVDDDQELVEFIKDDLDELYSVSTALNGSDALKIIKTRSIDLLVSDVLMPGIDGFQLSTILKTDLTTAHIPIVLLTAKDTLNSKLQGLGTGADAYIEKPFSPAYLQAQIANLLANRMKIHAHIRGRTDKVPDETALQVPARKPDFLEKLYEVIGKNIENQELDIDLIAASLNMSRPTLYRKTSSVSELTVNELINSVRIRQAASLLQKRTLKIYEVAAMVGFSSQTQFGRNFLKYFGLTPTEYMGGGADIKKAPGHL